MEIIRLSVPIVAPSLNKWYAGIHWSKRKKVVDEWHHTIWIICLQDKIKSVERYPVRITRKVILNPTEK